MYADASYDLGEKRTTCRCSDCFRWKVDCEDVKVWVDSLLLRWLLEYLSYQVFHLRNSPCLKLDFYLRTSLIFRSSYQIQLFLSNCFFDNPGTFVIGLHHHHSFLFAFYVNLDWLCYSVLFKKDFKQSIEMLCCNLSLRLKMERNLPNLRLLDFEDLLNSSYPMKSHARILQEVVHDEVFKCLRVFSRLFWPWLHSNFNRLFSNLWYFDTLKTSSMVLGGHLPFSFLNDLSQRNSTCRNSYSQSATVLSSASVACESYSSIL